MLRRSDLLVRWGLFALLSVGVQQLGSAAYVAGKAELAQWLIARAWQQSLAASGAPVRPWPWADTWPVARLSSAAHSADLFVLAGASGNALAFGPGHDSNSSLPGESGVAVIGGHRDTHFAFLQQLAPGTELEIQQRSGHWVQYRVAGTTVVDSALQPLALSPASAPELMLVTCYPFDGLLAGGSLRYLVHAVAADTTTPSTQPEVYAL